MTSESDKVTQPIDVQSEKNFQRFLENLSYPSVIHSNGKYVYANKAAADAAAEKAAALRAESQEEFKGNAPTILEGEVIVTM